MNVRMVLELAPPGVQHTEETRQIAADEFLVRGKSLEGLR